MWREVVIEQAQGVGQWGQRGSRLEAQAGSLDFTPAAVQAGSGGVGPLLRSAVAARCSTGVGLNVAVWWCDECGVRRRSVTQVPIVGMYDIAKAV